MTQVLLLSARDDDRRDLAAILDRTGWRLVAMPHPDVAPDAGTALDRILFPIALCDRDAAWKATMERIVAAHRDTCVILLSSVADEYLWNEVIQHGGFDVLTRPFRRERVLAMLEFAYTHWKTRWPKAMAD